VESLVSDYQFWIEKLGHIFHVVNTQDQEELIHQINTVAPDVIHVHCERHFRVVETLGVPVTILCSHWPSLYEPAQRQKVAVLTAGKSYICCLTTQMKDYFLTLGVTPSRLFVAKNGARADLFRFSERPRFATRSICLGTIDTRKRQSLVAGMDCIDFVGPKRDPCFSSTNYLGEWSKSDVYQLLTDYSNLVLLSRCEAAPLVTCEALMAGLGLVISESASVNLDRALPFITVIPEDRLADRKHIEEAVRDNQCRAISMRKAIRAYAVANFDWKHLVAQYVHKLEFFLSRCDNWRH
jgi:hypothetical protein